MRPTVFGIITLFVLVAGWFIGPEVADPSVAGLIWAGMAGVVAIGVIWPLLTASTVAVTLDSAPTDLVEGELSSIGLHLRGRCMGLSLAVSGSPVVIVDATAPSVTLVPLVLPSRGVYQSLEVEIGGDAPFGVLWAMRTVHLDLPTPLFVGPISEYGETEPEFSAGVDSEVSSIRTESMGESVRSVRPYVVGDPAHLVHWPSTARTGSVVVKEFDPPSEVAVAIVVDLGVRGPDPLFATREATARRAAGLAEYALSRGARVVLCTAEHSGPASGEVADLLSVRRRLAAAVEGDPAPPPHGWPVIRVTADDQPTGVGAGS